MEKLIDGDKVTDVLAELADEYNRIQHDPQIANGIDLAAAVIAQQPTVDAVRVVRCGECRYRGYECSIHREDDFYCADGEWKDGES